MQNSKILRTKAKGESLVEVIVALSIIVVAFTSVLALITRSINLGISARDKSETIGKIQEAKNLLIAEKFYGNCLSYDDTEINALINYQLTASDKCRNATYPIDASVGGQAGKCFYVVVNKLTGDEINVGMGMIPENYIKVTSVGRWNVKDGTIEQFSMSEIVKIPK